MRPACKPLPHRESRLEATELGGSSHAGKGLALQVEAWGVPPGRGSQLVGPRLPRWRLSRARRAPRPRLQVAGGHSRGCQACPSSPAQAATLGDPKVSTQSHSHTKPCHFGPDAVSWALLAPRADGLFSSTRRAGLSGRDTLAEAVSQIPLSLTLRSPRRGGVLPLGGGAHLCSDSLFHPGSPSALALAADVILRNRETMRPHEGARLGGKRETTEAPLWSPPWNVRQAAQGTREARPCAQVGQGLDKRTHDDKPKRRPLVCRATEGQTCAEEVTLKLRTKSKKVRRGGWGGGRRGWGEEAQ